MSNISISETAVAKLNFNAEQVVAVAKTVIDVSKQLLAAVTSVNSHLQNEKLALYVEKIAGVIALIEKFMNNQNVMNVITLLLKLVGSNTPHNQAELTNAVLTAFIG